MNRLITISIAIGTSLLLSSCGFKLRGEYVVPEQFKTLQLHSARQHSPLSRSLKTRLTAYDIDVKQTNDPQLPGIYLLPDNLDRRLLSLFSTGQVAEYELIYTVSYQVHIPQQDSKQYEFEVVREYQDDPETVLAKSRELDLILAEMRLQAADRIIRQLATMNKTNTQH